MLLLLLVPRLRFFYETTALLLYPRPPSSDIFISSLTVSLAFFTSLIGNAPRCWFRRNRQLSLKTHSAVRDNDVRSFIFSDSPCVSLSLFLLFYPGGRGRHTQTDSFTGKLSKWHNYLIDYVCLCICLSIMSPRYYSFVSDSSAKKHLPKNRCPERFISTQNRRRFP